MFADIPWTMWTHFYHSSVLFSSRRDKGEMGPKGPKGPERSIKIRSGRWVIEVCGWSSVAHARGNLEVNRNQVNIILVIGSVTRSGSADNAVSVTD